MKYLVLGLVLLGLVGCGPRRGLEKNVLVEPYIMCHPDTTNHWQQGAQWADNPVIHGYRQCETSQYVIRYKSGMCFYRKEKCIRDWETWHPKKKLRIGTTVFKIVDMYDPSKAHCEEALVWDGSTTVYIDFREPRVYCE